MQTVVALLRGINVGGSNRLPMRDLRDLLAELGCKDVRTYIQSGNVVFRSDSNTLSRDIPDAIKARFGFEPDTVVLQADEFESIVAANPYLEQVSEPGRVCTWFLAEEATQADLDRMGEKCGDNESFYLSTRAFYLYAPDGVGRSALATSAERLLGVAATARNWRTVCRIADMLRG